MYSGTAAIHLALILSGVSRGDEVICQSFTFAASAFTILYLEAKPIFVGSEKESWNMCPRYLENAILHRIEKGKKPKAIIFVNSYGMPAKINETTSLANKYDINLIEDAAESLGSEYDERKCGNFGDFSVFSFNSNKIITTSGGGALVTRSKKYKELSTHLATQAKNNKKYYEHHKLGYNYRLSDVLAAIGRGQMQNFERTLVKKRVNNIF